MTFVQAQHPSLSHYRIVSKLGTGGMGEVYLAEDLKLGRQVALKVLTHELTTNPEYLQRFEREARAASALNHPNILTVYEIGEADGARFIATEFIEGESLSQLIKRGPLELPEVLDLGIQIASALAAAHEAGILHRDIKPENIMVRKDRLVKVLDFGLAKLVKPEESDREAVTQALLRTTPGVVMGTINYMSPEQARGRDVDERSDIWSLGVVLHQLVTGRVPFTGDTRSDIIASILKTDPPPLVHEEEAVPRELEHVVSKALRKKREDRYQNIKDWFRRPGGYCLLALSLRQRPDRHRFPCDPALHKRHGRLGNGVSIRWPERKLINNLSQLPRLKVIARSSAFRYKGKDANAEEVARALGVKSILTGRILRQGENLQISVELMDARDNTQVWGSQYNRSGRDLMAVQQEIAREILRSLKLKLSTAEQSRVGNLHTANPEAYELYLKGRFYWNKRTAEALTKSVVYFNQAIEKDPSYALAYVGLADAYVVIPYYSVGSPRDSYPKAKAAARRALEIDDTLAEAHTTMAAVLMNFDWNLPESNREFERAIELNPNYATAHHWYAGENLTIMGQFDKALAEMRRAHELDPLSLIINANYAKAYSALAIAVDITFSPLKVERCR